MADRELWDKYFALTPDVAFGSASFYDQLEQLGKYAFSSQEPHLVITDVKSNEIVRTEIRDEESLARTINQPDVSGTRIISICSERTISPLEITSRCAAMIFQRYHVRKEFLRTVLSFGGEPHISEANSAYNAHFKEGEDIYILTYKLNYTERNVRSPQTPWSTRHLGIYHQHTPDHDLIIMLHCSVKSSFYLKLEELLKPAVNTAENFRDIARKLHIMALSCYVEDWRLYLRYQGDKFEEINDMAMSTPVEKSGDKGFQRMRNLRNIVDLTNFAAACCQSATNVVQLLTKSQCFDDADVQSLTSMGTVLGGFISSSEALCIRVQNTIDLIGYTLGLYNDMKKQSLDKEIRDMTAEMKNLAKETGAATSRLKELTEDSVDDSAIVRLITIVSAIYLPGSFVATIFGMNFFSFGSAQGSILITKDLWVFVVAWAGLTLATGALFYLTYRRTELRKRAMKLEDVKKYV